MQSNNISLLSAQQAACATGTLPTRYARNAHTLNPQEQGQLLAARVLLVGLGGLGGHVLDGLIRMGVGHITGVDGDIFEESNLNRQLLATTHSIGLPKTEVAAAYVSQVNPAVCFTPIARFIHSTEAFTPLMYTIQVVIDALGGLEHRAALHEAAAQASIPVVSAGIAGLTGWVCTVQPHHASPLTGLIAGLTTPLTVTAPTAPTAEEHLGNLVPTVMMAAALQCADVLTLLRGHKPPQGMRIFDLSDMYFMSFQP